MKGALDGIRVIDFGQYVAGPMAAMLLADQGADVIRVDPTHGPCYRVSGNAMWNRGKRSIALDLKREDDLKIALRLIDTADVVVENFRPGVMDRLGLGAEQSRRTNPGLIFCSIPGFSPSDPRANMPGWEPIISAAAGIYATRAQVNLGRDDMGNPIPVVADEPVYTPHPIASTFAAVLAATSITMALVARQRDGAGQHITVPLFNAAAFVAGEPERGVGYAALNYSPWSRQYECADGRLIFVHAKAQHLLLRFLEATGTKDWIDAEFDGDLQRAAQVSDPAHVSALIDRLASLFRTRNSFEWEDDFSTAGAPAAVCRSTADWLQNEHARSSGLTIEIDDPSYGPMLQPGLSVRLSATPGGVRAPAPRHDEHRAQILADLNAPRPPIVSLDPEPGNGLAALDGVRVLDFSIILAGPVCGRTLMEYGADVIKIDNPSGHATWNTANRGKRHIFLNLNNDRAQTIVRCLARDTDVLIENFRKGKIEALSLGYEEIRKIRPDIVYVSLSAYGREGPWSDRGGYEYQAQAATGMQERFGNGYPAKEAFLVNDYGTGALGSFAAALALFHRSRTGEGQRAFVSLASTAMLHQSSFMNSYVGKTWDQPRGQSVLGTAPLNRMYRVKDGWVALCAPGLDAESLTCIEGLEGLGSSHNAQVVVVLEEFMKRHTASEAIDKMLGGGVAAHRVQSVPECMADPWAYESGLHLTLIGSEGEVEKAIGPAVEMSRTHLRSGSPFRASSGLLSVVSDAGMKDDIESLIESGAIALSGPPQRMR